MKVSPEIDAERQLAMDERIAAWFELMTLNVVS
jgi:hypothetical protein